MWLTPEVARDLDTIIREHHGAVAAVIFGPTAVSLELMQRAIMLGLIDPAHPKESLARLMLLFGAYQGSVGEEPEMGLEAFRNLLSGQGMPITPTEEASAAYAARSAADLVVGMGSKASARFTASMHDMDQQIDYQLREDIRDVISARFGDEDAMERVREKGIEEGLTDDYFDGLFRATVGRVRSDIGHLTQDWRRDLQRIAQTELHGAVQNGQVERWMSAAEEESKTTGKPIKDPLVYKLPRDGACKHCIRLHLDGSFPRVYKMSHAIGNGTNYGRKAPDWEFVVGSVHPWCGCPIFKVPGWVSMPSGWQSGDAAPGAVRGMGRVA